MFRCTRKADDDATEQDNGDSASAGLNSAEIQASLNSLNDSNADHQAAEVQVMYMKQFNPLIVAPVSAINTQESKRNCLEIYWNRYLSFAASPKVAFVYEAVFYVAFLFLFSYVLLCRFNYSENDTTEATNMTNLYANASSLVVESRPSLPSWPELVLIFWVLSFIVDEAHQFHFSEACVFN